MPLTPLSLFRVPGHLNSELGTRNPELSDRAWCRTPSPRPSPPMGGEGVQFGLTLTCRNRRGAESAGTPSRTRRRVGVFVSVTRPEGLQVATGLGEAAPVAVFAGRDGWRGLSAESELAGVERGCVRNQNIRPATSARPTPRHNNGFLIRSSYKVVSGAGTLSHRRPSVHRPDCSVPPAGASGRCDGVPIGWWEWSRCDHSARAERAARVTTGLWATKPARRSARRDGSQSELFHPRRAISSRCLDAPGLRREADSVLTRWPVRVVSSASSQLESEL